MKFLLAFLFSSTLLFCGCIDINTGERVNGNGNVTTETRTVKSAEKIKLTGDMDVILETGPTSIRVEADENILPYLTTAMDEDWLEIGMKDHIDIHSNNPIRVNVTSPTISQVEVTGSGNVSAKQKLQTDEPMVCNVTGSGDINMSIHTARLTAAITGSGNIKLSGETKDIEVSVTGSGKFQGPELSAENVKVNISGSGDVSLMANASLDADIQGSGSIKYKGNPVIHKNIGGSGSVEKIN